MTDIEKALAEALMTQFYLRSDIPSPDELASRLAATPQMQAIAEKAEKWDRYYSKAAHDELERQAAIGAAVERASDEYLVVRRLPSLGSNYPAAWQVWREDADGVDYPTVTRPTLPAAIVAALDKEGQE